jgi:cytidylate kinase
MRVITVSRSYGSAGTLFARQLSEVLGYRYADEALINKISESQGVRETFAVNVEDEIAPGFFEKLAELANNRSFFKGALETCIYDLALKGDLIFVGGGAHLVLEGSPCLFDVQIVRNLRDRIKAIAGEKGISYDEAFELLKKKDKQKVNFIRHYFDKELFDPTMFHLIINASRIPIDDAVQMVAEEARKIFSSADDREAERFLKKRLTESKAQLVLFGLDLAREGKIIFDAQEGVLIVKGVIGGKNEKERVLAALSRLPEVNRIDDQLTVEVLSRMLY